MEFKRIIVRMPNWIGDMVMATPILEDLRAKFPDSHITVMCRYPICALLEKNPNIDAIFGFSKVNIFTHRIESRDIVDKLQQGRYDLGIILTRSFSAAWLFWIGKVRKRIGYPGRGSGFFLTNKVAFPQNSEKIHQINIYKRVLEPLKIPISDTLPKIFLSQSEIDDAKDCLKRLKVNKTHKLVGINPGAAYGQAKCWPAEKFREVTKELIKRDITVLYFGEPSFAPIVKKLCHGFPEGVVDLCGKTSLRELAAMISLCDTFLTNDSGPMHMACAVKTPVVALFGPTNQDATGPYGVPIEVINKKASCSPCYLRVCRGDFRCMLDIKPQEVIEAVLRMLGQNDKKIFR